MCVTRACWRASEWGSAKKSLYPRTRRSEGIVGLRAPHVTAQATIGVKGLRMGISPHASENVVRAYVRMTSEVGDLVFAGEDTVHRLIVGSDQPSAT
ncbi:jg6381 [Pararge aegeria aegeria]|uniref:Jg6381 protein n=1 Tax=Pararge aegeria aegeria TaxID=348720 RepID=A0A8S4RR78_9NEOP|nr:jg6381 [Pararge aegeria aegeria]